MKKLLSLVLVCAMGLGMVSCVESEESPSVEAIRNAKAEQLKALSNLYNAQAEAAKVTANAEAALLNAQAEYQKEMTKEAAEKFAVEIQVIKAQADSAILAAQKASAQYEKEILEMAHAKIQVLYTQYSAYAGQLAQAKQDLLDAKVELAAQEAGIVSVKEAAQNTVASETAKIAQYEAELAVLAASDLANAEDVNVDSLNIEKQKAYVAWKEAEAAYNAKEVKARKDAYKVYNETSIEWNTELNKQRELYKVVYYTYDNQGNRVRHERDYRPFISNYYDLSEDNWVNKVEIDETNLQEWKDYVANLNKWTTAEDVEAAEEALAEKEEALAEKQEELADAEANSTAVAAYVKQIQDAVKAKDAAVKTLTAAWVKYDSIDDLEAAAKKAADDVKTAEAAEKAAKADAEAAAKALTAAQKALADAKTLEPKVKEHEATIKAAKDAVAAAEKEVKSAQDAVKKAEDAKAALKADATDVQKADADVAIANAKAALAVKEANLAAAKADQTAKEKAFEAFKTANKLTGTATEIAEAIAKAEVAVFEADKNNVAKAEAYTKAQGATAKAKAAAEKAKAEAANADAIAAAFVAAVAPAKEAEAALVALLKNEDFEDLGISYTTENHSVEYAKGKTAAPVQTIDANKDGNPDFAQSNGVFTEKYDVDAFKHTKVTTDLKAVAKTAADAVKTAEDAVKTANNAVLAAKDDLAYFKRWENNDQFYATFQRNWKENTEAAEAELREWCETMTAKGEEISNLRAAYYDALDAEEVASIAVAALEGEYDAILALLAADNSNDITKAIDDLNDKIATAKEAIAIAENVLNGSDYDSVEYQEAVLAIAKENVAKLEAEVEGLTKMVEHAKAELEAAVAAHVAE